MWHIQVRYKNNAHDIVPAFMLDKLIAAEKIKQFYRPSERRWITLGLDPVRTSARTHDGLERRRPAGEMLYARAN
jgi:hypothetical protein